MISGTEPANAAVVARDTPATTRPHAARVGAWALADWLIPLALALVTFAVFSPALSNNFVDWDDQINLTGNEEYRGLGTAQLKYFFTTVLMGHYIPLTWLTFGLDYVQWGMNPTGYHLTSLLLYAANAAVLYLVSLRLLARATTLAGLPLRLGAVAATLFFALHPLRAESVAWVTERRDVLSGLFFLLTILAYLRMRDASGPRRYWLLAASAGAYVLALSRSGARGGGGHCRAGRAEPAVAGGADGLGVLCDRARPDHRHRPLGASADERPLQLPSSARVRRDVRGADGRRGARGRGQEASTGHRGRPRRDGRGVAHRPRGSHVQPGPDLARHGDALEVRRRRRARLRHLSQQSRLRARRTRRPRGGAEAVSSHARAEVRHPPGVVRAGQGLPRNRPARRRAHRARDPRDDQPPDGVANRARAAHDVVR